MGGKAKSGTHLAAAIQVLPFFLEHTTNSGAIYLKFHPQRGVLQKRKKKINTCFPAPFVSLSAQIVIELEFLVILPLLTGTNV